MFDFSTSGFDAASFNTNNYTQVLSSFSATGYDPMQPNFNSSVSGMDSSYLLDSYGLENSYDSSSFDFNSPLTSNSSLDWGGLDFNSPSTSDNFLDWGGYDNSFYSGDELTGLIGGTSYPSYQDTSNDSFYGSAGGSFSIYPSLTSTLTNQFNNFQSNMQTIYSIRTEYS
jgi:hypothetical protein